MRVVTDPADLEGELAAAGAEALSAFGDATVFVEPYLPTARHIEVQVMADTHGTCWVVGDRDCSIQRRHQKVVEEAPAPAVSDPVRTTLHDAARAAVKAVDYVGAGTVEFLVADAHLDTGKAYFLEMNTRLQVEHPVTEEVFGVDLVAEQIRVAEGAQLGEEPSGPQGHAIEVRLYAEDPADDWQPQTGTVRTFEVPGGVRVDSGVECGLGRRHPLRRDAREGRGPRRRPGHGATPARRRPQAYTHPRRLDQPRLPPVDPRRRGVRRRARTHGAARRTARRVDQAVARRAGRTPDSARCGAGRGHDGNREREGARPDPDGVPQCPEPAAHPDVRLGEDDITVSYSAGFVQHDLEGVTVVEAGPTRVVLDADGITETYEIAVGDGWVDVDGPHGSITLTPVPTFVDPADVVAEGSLLAPMPAAVISVAVADGQHVTKGDVVVVLEAMKMQHTITAPTDGVVSELSVTPGSQVESGAVLAVIHVSTSSTNEGTS